MGASKRNDIYNFILLNIFSGKWSPGDFIFSENQFTLKFDCSRITVRSILQDLVSQNILGVEHGRGYFVTTSALSFMIGNIPHDDLVEFEEVIPKKYTHDILKENWLDRMNITSSEVNKFGAMFQRSYSKKSKLISFELLWVNKNQVVAGPTEKEYEHLLPILDNDYIRTLQYRDILIFDKLNPLLPVAKKLGWNADFPIKLSKISNGVTWVTLSLRIYLKEEIQFESSKTISLIHTNNLKDK